MATLKVPQYPVIICLLNLDQYLNDPFYSFEEEKEEAGGFTMFKHVESSKDHHQELTAANKEI